MFGKVKSIQGRDYINITDILGTQCGYKIDKFSNKSHYVLQSKDTTIKKIKLTKGITEDGKKNYSKGYNPLDPKYEFKTKSKRHKITLGDIDKNKPK